MCGIVYAQSFNGTPVNHWVKKQYKDQKSRGSEGFGLFNGQHLVKAAEEKRILKWLRKPRNESDLIMFHHRWPTSTINVRQAAHPFTTKDYFGDVEYVLIHNGVINNPDKLFVDHQELGIDYQSLLSDLTFNDSESLLWDFALTMEGKQESMKAYGGIAFVCMRLVKGKLDRLYFGRNWYPLKLLRNDQGIQLSSEGAGESIEADTLYTFYYKSKRLVKKAFEIKSWSGYSSVTTYGDEQSPYPYSSSSSKALNYGDDDGYYHGMVRDPYTGLYRRPVPELDYNAAEGAYKRSERSSERSSESGFEKDDIAKAALKLLNRADGVFEVAFWHAYAEILGAEEDNDDEAQEYWEKVQAFIGNDPEYVSNYSVSSIWMERKGKKLLSNAAEGAYKRSERSSERSSESGFKAQAKLGGVTCK